MCLKSNSQGPGLRILELMIAGPTSGGFNSRVPGLRVLGFRSPGLRVPGSESPLVSGSRVSRSQVLILDYANKKWLRIKLMIQTCKDNNLWRRQYSYLIYKNCRFWINTRFSDFQFRRYNCESLPMKKKFVCKQTSCVIETSVKIARQCAFKDRENGDYELERWKKTHSSSTRALSGIYTCEVPFR